MTERSPVLHLLAGPNGAGKPTYYREILRPQIGLPWINADEIAEQRWPDDPVAHGHDAGRIAQERRSAAVAAGTSFISETVFSHPSKLDLVRDAAAARYFVYLYVLVVPEDLAVIRVGLRVEEGGHDVPEDKIRLRHRRLWEYVAAAVDSTYEARVVDSRLPSFPEVARFRFGQLNWVTDEDLSWLPDALKDLLRPAR